MQFLILRVHIAEKVTAEVISDGVKVRFETRHFLGEACADVVEQLADGVSKCGLQGTAVGGIAHLTRPLARETAQIAVHIDVNDGQLDVVQRAFCKQTEIGGVIVLCTCIEIVHHETQKLLFQRFQLNAVRKCAFNGGTGLNPKVADVFEGIVDIQIGISSLISVILRVRFAPCPWLVPFGITYPTLTFLDLDPRFRRNRTVLSTVLPQDT